MGTMAALISERQLESYSCGPLVISPFQGCWIHDASSRRQPSMLSQSSVAVPQVVDPSANYKRGERLRGHYD